MLKKTIEIKLGFWDNVRKYKGKKHLGIKLGFRNINACWKPRFEIQYCRARIIHNPYVTYWF